MNATETIFRTVLEISWRASWLILAVVALRALLRRHLPARVLFWAWIAVAIRLLWPFAVPASWSPFNFARFAPLASPAITAGATVGKSPSVATAPSAMSGLASNALSANQTASSIWKSTPPAQWIALVWGTGVVALLLARAGAYARFARALRRSRLAPDAILAARLAEAAGPARTHRITVSTTDVVRAPALHGILRPELLFPPGFIEKLTPRELQLTLAHELAHDRRRDLLAHVLIHGAVILHWFNPLAWLAARKAREDCELACDESVLRHLTAAERESYGATLLKIIRLASAGTPPPLALGVVESKQQIKRRIVMIMAQPASPLARTVLGCALFLFATGLSLTAETLGQSAPAVTESRSEPVRRVVKGPDPSQWKFTYDASTDRLDILFSSGVVAAVSDRTITVADVRREVQPLVPMLQREARDQEDFNLRLNRLQNSVIRDLVGRILYIKEFHVPTADGNEKHIPENYIDNEVDARIKDQFDNDRAKLLAYLQTRGVTMTDFRHEIEEEIIYHYMVGQERNLNKNESEKKAKLADTPVAPKAPAETSTPNSASASDSELGSDDAANRSITLIALDAVRVMVKQRLPNDVEGAEIFVGTLARGQQQRVPWTGPIYIYATAGEKLEIEVKGKRYPTQFTGTGRAMMN